MPGPASLKRLLGARRFLKLLLQILVRPVEIRMQALKRRSVDLSLAARGHLLGFDRPAQASSNVTARSTKALSIASR